MLRNLLEIQKLHPAFLLLFLNSTEGTAVFMTASSWVSGDISRLHRPRISAPRHRCCLLIESSNPESLSLLCFALAGKYETIKTIFYASSLTSIQQSIVNKTHWAQYGRRLMNRKETNEGKAFWGKTGMLKLSKLNTRFDGLTSTKINHCGGFENIKSLSSSDLKCSQINRKISRAWENKRIRTCRRDKQFILPKAVYNFFTSFFSLVFMYTLVHKELKHLCIALQIITEIFYSDSCSFRWNYL